MKDVLVVTADNVGIMEILRKGISAYTDLTFDSIDHHAIRRSFRYKNFGHRTKNFFLKNLAGRNLKIEYYNSLVKQTVNQLQSSYKKILIIRPDLLSDEHLLALRQRTTCFIAYYWDTVDFFPRKQEIIHFFDRIVSFDPCDCKKYGFEFQPNFYYYENLPVQTRYHIYNLSSFDDRSKIVEEIAMALEDAGLSYLFKAFREKPFKNPYIQYTPRIAYEDMITELACCDVVLDVTKKGQGGLTLRPFEALGLNKKLITTNAGILQYEFYHPDNILVVEPGNIRINRSFFDKPFKEIPEDVRQKHHIKSWLERVLG